MVKKIRAPHGKRRRTHAMRAVWSDGQRDLAGVACWYARRRCARRRREEHPSRAQQRVRSREHAAETWAWGRREGSRDVARKRFRAPCLLSSAANEAGRRKRGKIKWRREVGGGGVGRVRAPPTNHSSVDAIAREGVVHSPDISAVPVVTVVSHFIVLRDLAHANTLPSTRDVKNAGAVELGAREEGGQEFAKKGKKSWPTTKLPHFKMT